MKISQFQPASTLTGAEIVPVVQDGHNRQVTTDTILDWISPSFDAAGTAVAVKAATYNDQLVVVNSNQGLDATLRAVQSGNGIASALHLSTSKFDGLVVSSGTTTPRLLSDRLGERVSVKDFGALGDGLADDTAAIQAAINACQSASGGTVFLPPGHYIVSSTLSVSSSSVRIAGAGRNITILEGTSATTHVVEFGGTTFDSTIESLTIAGLASPPTAGAGIHTTNGVGAIIVRDVRVESTWNGIQMDNTPNSGISGVLKVSQVDLSTLYNDGILVNGCSQLFVNEVTTYQDVSHPGNAGIHLKNGGGFYIVNSTCGGSPNGIQIDPTTGNAVYDVFVANFEADTCRGNSANAGIAIDSSGGGSIYGVQLVNCRCGFGLGKGIAINGANTLGIMADNCRAEKNQYEGLWIGGGAKITFSNFHACGNSALSAGSYAGINIVGGTDIEIIGGIAGASLYNGGEVNQSYGVAIQVSFSGALLIDAMNVRAGNVSAGLINSSTSTNVRLLNILGYNPVGVKYPGVGSSPWTYTAGASPEHVMIIGGTVSQITVGGLDIVVTSGSFMLAPGQEMVITYTVAPNFVSMVQ